MGWDTCTLSLSSPPSFFTPLPGGLFIMKFQKRCAILDVGCKAVTRVLWSETSELGCVVMLKEKQIKYTPFSHCLLAACILYASALSLSLCILFPSIVSSYAVPVLFSCWVKPQPWPYRNTICTASFFQISAISLGTGMQIILFLQARVSGSKSVAGAADAGAKTLDAKKCKCVISHSYKLILFFAAVRLWSCSSNNNNSAEHALPLLFTGNARVWQVTESASKHEEFPTRGKHLDETCVRPCLAPRHFQFTFLAS